MDNKPDNKMHNKTPYFVSAYPERPKTPWKLEMRAKFFGKKIRRFFETEGEAWAAGAWLADELRRGGTAATQRPHYRA